MSDGKRIAVLSSAGGGGAGIAARRMADALTATGPHIADFIDIASIGEAVAPSISPQDSLTNHTISDTHFTVENSGYQRGWLVDLLSGYDLVNVHWASYLINIGELLELALRGQRMLFMLHDFYYTTGGCHYPASCTQLGKGCLSCPQVDTSRCAQLTIAENYALKQKIFAQPNVHLAAPSAFVRNKAVTSGMVPQERGHVLRNAYQPVFPLDHNRAFTHRILLIADSLQEGRKNMHFALEVLATLNQSKPAGTDFVVDVIGDAAPQMKAYLAATNVPHVFHGRITDHTKLASIMAQTDILLTTSLEDNWPNILVEAGSYGCIPVVGPDHGCEEFVRHYNFGEVTPDYSRGAFVSALIKTLTQHDPDKRRRAAETIRAEHAPNKAAQSFHAVMEQISFAQ